MYSIDSVQTYTVQQGDVEYFEWIVTGGVVLDSCGTCNLITVAWSDTATTRSLSVAPYNRFQARGATQVIEVELISGQTNTWNGQSGNWFNPEKWSQGRVPLPCDQVVLSSNDELLNIAIPVGEFVTVRSLSTIGNVQINIATGSTLEVID